MNTLVKAIVRGFTCQETRDANSGQWSVVSGQSEKRERLQSVQIGQNLRRRVTLFR